VSLAVRDALTLRAADFGITLEDVAITHLSFGTEFTKAVEMKQVAEQDAERARFVVLKAEQERNAAIIRAEGESEAARLISDATKVGARGAGGGGRGEGGAGTGTGTGTGGTPWQQHQRELMLLPGARAEPHIGL
jgi:regulator of protease activity HflC (stomatin/prohibitin superfamily)